MIKGIAVLIVLLTVSGSPWFARPIAANSSSTARSPAASSATRLWKGAVRGRTRDTDSCHKMCVHNQWDFQGAVQQVADKEQAKTVSNNSKQGLSQLFGCWQVTQKNGA